MTKIQGTANAAFVLTVFFLLAYIVWGVGFWHRTPMKTALALISIVALAACHDLKKAELEWGQRCLHAGYTGDQCGLMLEQLKTARQAIESANVAAGMSGFAAGMAIANSGGRK